MATIETSLDPTPGDAGVRFERVTRRRRREVLSVLLSGERDPNDEAVDHFLRFVSDQGLKLDWLYAAMVGGEPVAAAAVLPSAGRTGVVLCSPVADRGSIPLTTAVVGHAVADEPGVDATLVQSLTDPGQTLERRAVGRAGFEDLATLVYMERDVPTGLKRPSIETALSDGLFAEAGRSKPTAASRLTRLHWAPRHRHAFEHVVLESYVNTLDCPGLLGLRSIEDVMAGHMATGKFDPKLWWAFYDGREPVAVLLVSRVAQRDAHELVYLGVAEPYRGLGLGESLVQLALHGVSKRGGGRMFLAVDQRNRPAVKLYQRYRFRINAHKRAMVLRR